MNNINKSSKKPLPPVYVTLGLAEKMHTDKELKTTNPSIENVELTRKWSEENKL